MVQQQRIGLDQGALESLKKALPLPHEYQPLVGNTHGRSLVTGAYCHCGLEAASVADVVSLETGQPLEATQTR